MHFEIVVAEDCVGLFAWGAALNAVFAVHSRKEASVELLLLDAALARLLGQPVIMKLEKGGVVNGTLTRYSARRVGGNDTRLCIEVAVGKEGQQSIDFGLRELLEVTRTDTAEAEVVELNTLFGRVSIIATKKRTADLVTSG